LLFLPRAISEEVSSLRCLEFLRDKWEVIFLVLLVLVLINYSTYRVHCWRQRRTGLGGWSRLVYRSCICYGIMATGVAVGALSYFAALSNSKLNQRLGWMTANQPIQLQSGERLLPLYSDRFVASIMAISDDGGNSWKASQPLVSYGSIQPTVLERSNGHVVAMMRENGVHKRIRYSVSDNQGRNWSTVQETICQTQARKLMWLL